MRVTSVQGGKRGRGVKRRVFGILKRDGLVQTLLCLKRFEFADANSHNDGVVEF